MSIRKAAAGPAPATPAAVAPVGDHGRHHRWALLGYAIVLLAALARYGVDPTLGFIADALNVIFVAFFIRQLGFAVSAARWAQGDLAAASVGGAAYTPSVAVLVACRDEEPVIDDMITALLALDYPAEALTLVVVDDGSTDGTAERLATWAAIEPRLRVLHRLPDAGGGRSGALNSALVGIRAELTVIFDADHEPERSVLRRLVRHFRDPRVGAVTGRRVVRNASLASTIFVDYLSGYLVNEYGRQALFELPANGGASCAVRTSVLRALSGWHPDTDTGDTDLTLRVLLGGRRVRYDPTAVDFEQAALSSRRFWRQRYRWARGHQQGLRDFWWPAVRSRHLSVIEKVETVMFLSVYHVPVLCGIGLLLAVLRVFGIGGASAAGLLPLAALLFAGPLAALSVGLLLGRVERRAAWLLLGFLPAAAMAIVTATAAYLNGMWGRPAGRSTTAAADAAYPAAADAAYPAGAAGRIPRRGVTAAGSFARRDSVPS